MAADELDEDFDPAAIDEDIDEENLDETALDEDLADADDVIVDADALVETDDEEEVAVVPVDPAAKTRTKKGGGSDEEEDDDDELDPDDVEADLDTILKDRIAAADDDDDDEELEEVPAKTVADAPDGVVPKRANEFTCTECFLLVNRGQFGPEHNLRCPVGESDCPVIDELKKTPKPKPAKAAARKR